MAVLNSTTVTQKHTALPVDRTLIAIGNSGSSLAVSLDDVTSIWLSHLNLVPSVQLKLETSPVDLPDRNLSPSTAFPPITLFLPTPSPAELPAVTTQLIERLPHSPDVRQQLLYSVDDVLALHPSFNFQDFQVRVHSLFSWSSETASALPSTSGGTTASRPTLSFFAATSAAFALGSLIRRTNDTCFVSLEGGNAPPASAQHFADEDPCSYPAALFSLSEQALNIFERSYNYDLDYMVATILQVMYLLHDGRPRLPHTILPLVSSRNYLHE